ncbi:hypothetical protein DXB55_00505 [Streptococcus anginosus]|uniref:hypothetical protein n=1 Tax=Streptococcus anginosus TaxID=1328 RepID=UPI000E4350F7|nr:hypothetical protein [Streptococcus anginosus]RGN68218.1 hypothetical protein DXB55_00505 [Streptococcus anginosus]
MKDNIDREIIVIEPGYSKEQIKRIIGHYNKKQKEQIKITTFESPKVPESELFKNALLKGVAYGVFMLFFGIPFLLWGVLSNYSTNAANVYGILAFIFTLFFIISLEDK